MTRCEFCGASATYVYRTHSTETKFRPSTDAVDFLFVLGGDWTACNECRRLIASGRRDDLLDRSLTYAMTEGPYAEEIASRPSGQRLRLVSQLRSMIRAIHDDFWVARFGAPEPLDQ